MANLKPNSRAFMRSLTLIFLLSCIMIARAADPDSLANRLKQALPDTERAQTLMKLGKLSLAADFAKGASYMKQALVIYEGLHDKKRAGLAFNQMGTAYSNYGLFDSSLAFYAKGYNYLLECKDTAGFIYAEKNAGTVYFVINNYNKALEYFFHALRYAEKLNSPKELASCLGNIGNVYKEQGKLREALAYYMKSRTYAMQMGSVGKLAVNYINSGNVYYDMFKHIHKSVYLDSAYYLYTLGESTLLADPDSSVLSMLYSNIANVFAEKKQFKQAINLYERSLTIKRRINEESQIALLYENLATCYLEMNLPDKAEVFILEGLKEASEYNSYEDMSSLYRDYSEFYRAKKNFPKAYEYYVLYKQYADSVLNDENIERRKELEMNYSFDKEREQNLLEQREKEVLRKEEKKRSLIYIAVTVGGLVITIIIALIIFRNLRTMKRAHAIISKQKSEIEKQKELVEEKQKEILDSIHYAKRIQRSLLPTEKYINRNLKHLHG